MNLLAYPPQISTDPIVDDSAMAWAGQLVDTLNRLINGGIDSGNIKDGAVTSAKILDGTIVNADLSGGYPQLVSSGLLLCSASLTLSTADQDVAGCSIALGAGTWLVTGVFDFFHSVNGGGLAVGKLNVGGTVQSNQAILNNTGSANGDRATVAQSWIFSIGSSQTVKLQATKTINAGTVQAVITHTSMTYLRLS